MVEPELNQSEQTVPLVRRKNQWVVLSSIISGGQQGERATGVLSSSGLLSGRDADGAGAGPGAEELEEGRPA